MKDRRGFLKLLGIGAGAACAGVLAAVAGRSAATPAPAPRTIQDIEKVKPYIGPDSIPGGDYIKERPPVVPNNPPVPETIFPEMPAFVIQAGDIPAEEWIAAFEPGVLTLTMTGTYNPDVVTVSNTCDIQS